jgi:putative membrane protein
MWHGGDWNAWEWVVMSLMMVLFWGGLIALVAWIVHNAGRGWGGPPWQAPSSRELLAQHSRGEIDQDEFTQRPRAIEEADAEPSVRSHSGGS